jgi:hypothetical protein
VVLTELDPLNRKTWPDFALGCSPAWHGGLGYTQPGSNRKKDCFIKKLQIAWCRYIAFTIAHRY